jgi:hypothetical protein
LVTARKLGVAAVLLYCSYLVVMQGLAGRIAESALDDMTVWAEAAEDPEGDNRALLQSAYDGMRRANKLDPGHPTFLHRLGRISHLFMALELAQRDEWGEKAKGYYRQSLAVRGAWPLTWGSLALVKADLLEFDAEMDEALTKATTFGPWEPGVHLMVATIGIDNMQFLTPTLQAVVVANVERGLQSPVRGTAADVLAVINLNEPNPVRLAALGTMLVQVDWSKNTSLWVRITVEHWGIWRAVSQSILRERLVAELIKEPALVRFLTNANVLTQVCPFLPRKPKFSSACRRL